MEALQGGNISSSLAKALAANTNCLVPTDFQARMHSRTTKMAKKDIRVAPKESELITPLGIAT